MDIIIKKGGIISGDEITDVSVKPDFKERLESDQERQNVITLITKCLSDSVNGINQSRGWSGDTEQSKAGLFKHRIYPRE